MHPRLGILAIAAVAAFADGDEVPEAAAGRPVPNDAVFRVQVKATMGGA